MTQMRTSTVDGCEQVLTIGMTDSSGRVLVGIYDNLEDARSVDADELAVGSTFVQCLTPEQLADAEHNSNVLTL